MKLPKKLPKKFRTLFWDSNFEIIDPSSKPLYVINRILDKGDLEAIHWVRQNFPEELIKETLKKLRDYSLKSATFWATIYNIPFTQVKCLQKPYLATRRQLWPH